MGLTPKWRVAASHVLPDGNGALLPRSALACARHDLRSAIHSVLGFADLLASPSFGELNQEQSHFITQLRAAAARVLELADASTDLADGAERVDPHGLVPTPIASFLKSTCFALAQVGGEGAPVLDLDPRVDAAQVAVDAEVLRRVFLLGKQLLRGEEDVCLHITAARFEHVVIITVGRGSEPVLIFATPDELEPSLSSRELVRFKLMEVLLSRYGGSLRASATLKVIEMCLPLVESREGQHPG